MTQIDLFLKNAPKSLIHQIFQGLNTEKSGLMSNSKILSTVSDKLKSKDAFLERWALLNDSEKKILTNIYFAGSNGLSLGDLTYCVSPAEQFLLKHTLIQLCYDLFIYRSEEEKNHYFGFEDYRNWVLESISFQPVTAPGNPKSYQGRLDLHLFSVSSFLIKSDIPVSQNGEVNKRFFNQMQSRLKVDHPLTDDVDSREEELNQLILFLSQKKLLNKSGNILSLDLDLFNQLIGDRSQQPSQWVVNDILKFDELNLSSLSAILADSVEITEFVQFFSAFTKTQSQKFEHWHQLPKWVKLLWWSGLINFNISENNIIGVSATKELAANEMPIYFLPNFEVHVPLNSNAQTSLLMEFAAEIIREDQLSTYKISAESIHKLLNAHFPTQLLKELLVNHALPPNVKEALDQWIFAHEGARIESALFLEVDDAETLANVSSLPQCQEWGLLKVEDKGLLVPTSKKENVLELMNTFGFYLKEPQVAQELSPYTPPSTELEAEVPAATPNYIEKKPTPLNIHIGELGKYGGGLQELEFNERLRVIEYAILTDSRLELLTTEDRVAKMVLPKDLLRTDPISLEAKHFPSGDSLTHAVESIKKIRVVD